MKAFLAKITPIQWLGIIVLFNSTLIGGSTFLADLFIPPAGVKAILAVAGLGNGFLGGLITMFGSPTNVAMTADQETLIRQVLAMPGVQHIDVNKQANQTLATLAVDPNIQKIAPTPEAKAQVTATAATLEHA